jgi:SAM-dependent methyltransferase
MSITLNTELSVQSSRTILDLPSLKEDDATYFARKVFSDQNEPFSKYLQDIIWSYIPLETAQIKSPFPSFVNLSSRIDLMPYLGSSFQGKSDVDNALRIAKKMYEFSPRCIRTDLKYGMAFAIDAEVLAYAMKIVKEREGDIAVCELACASGENGLLLAHAGAQKVTFNDIDPGSIKNLRKELQNVSTEVQKACEIDEGSCLDLLQRKPELENQVDLIVCRNLIHFFNNEELSLFLKLINKMLKPNGQAIFTANSVYVHRELAQEAQLDKFQETTFNTMFCYIHDRTDSTKGLNSTKTLCSTAKLCQGDSISATEYTEHYIYERDHNTGLKWQANKEEFNKLDAGMKAKIKEKLKIYSKEIAQIPRGSVRVLSAHVRLYNPISLKALFENHGFIVASTFLVDIKGHLIHDPSEVYKKGQQIGIAVSRS